MLQQPLSVINKAGATTADDRMVSYAQSSSTPSLQYSAGFAYDNRGNRLAQSSSLPSTHPAISYGYNVFSRMTGCTNGTTSVVYAYDALGRKVKRLKRNTTIYPDSTYYIYDGLDPICMVEFNPAHTECTTEGKWGQALSIDKHGNKHNQKSMARPLRIEDAGL